jgi:selenoprotein W-related protein
LTEQLLQHFGTDVASLELVPGRGGVFEVTRDGQSVFSKRAMGRFPEWDEIRSVLASRPGR